MQKIRLVHQDSGKTDYGTPINIIGAARATMGEITLDPATAPYWNKAIRAKKYWHISNVTNRWHQPPRFNPLELSWRVYGKASKVFMNHPYGRGNNLAWIEKVHSEYVKRNVLEACVLTFAEQSTKWGQILTRFPRWFPEKRLAHLGRDGKPNKGGTKGSMVTYIGPNVYEFVLQFSLLGGHVDLPAENYIAELRKRSNFARGWCKA